MSTFRAVVIEKNHTGQTVALTDFSEADLMEGDVTLRVTHTTVNYKDGLAITGKAPVVRRFPMIPGVDCAGVVETSIQFVIEPHTRFPGQPGEQSTMFFLDPAGNALEFKAFADLEQLFAQ